LATYNIPATLLHGDLHLGNITQRNGEYLFFDWTDAAVSFPFLDLFVLYFEFGKEADAPRLRDAYLQAWREDETPARLLEAWELVRPLCALHHSVSYLTIDQNIEPLARDELFHGLPDNLHDLLDSFKSA
jgi:aminoglycoside phosphotransferase (APT) family kinase protein